ncbi:MAG TPA: hypothetical protein VLT33_24790 [Labilithrix sp.]|nr:hypothetical protein [Labilithrix sp.]
MRPWIGLALVTCTILGCAAPAPAPVRSTTTAASTPPGVPLAAPEGPPAPASRCRLTVTDTEGCGPADVEKIIEPVRPRLERCRTTTGGKLLVRVRKAGRGRLAFDLEPGSSLDPTEKRCVLDALASLEVDESSTAWTGLNVRPTGFTSLITIEW